MRKTLCVWFRVAAFQTYLPQGSVGEGLARWFQVRQYRVENGEQPITMHARNAREELAQITL